MKQFTRRLNIVGWLLSAVLSLCSCSSTTTPASRQESVILPVETLWAGNQSSHAGPQPQAVFISDAAQFNAMAQAESDWTTAAIVAPQRIDWRREAVVWLFMGSKPTGGYGLRLASPAASVSHGIAVITIQWRDPAPGAMLTQQLTSPFLVLKLQKGAYDRIEIKDLADGVRFRLAARGRQ